MNPRELAVEERRQKLREFFHLNYANYYGILIFKPTQPNSEFAHDANMLWLIKNGIQEITL